jgi:hypothetical protein
MNDENPTATPVGDAGNVIGLRGDRDLVLDLSEESVRRKQEEHGKPSPHHDDVYARKLWMGLAQPVGGERGIRTLGRALDPTAV